MRSLLFLGSGGSMITRTRVCSGILFGNKLLDCGFGVLSNLRRGGISLEQIDELYVTHMHADHIGDFTAIVWAMQLEGRKKPLRVICSERTRQSLNKILDLQSTPEGFVKFKLLYMSPKEAAVQYCRTDHEPENLAYRVELGGREMVYTGDTGYSRAVATLSEGVHALIHEATFLRDQTEYARATKHSTAGDAGRIAEEAKAKKLLLTHLSPLNDGREEEYVKEARTAYRGEVIVACDLLKVVV